MKIKKKYQIGGEDPITEAIKKGIVQVPDEYKYMYPQIFGPQNQQEKMPYSFMPQPGSISRNNVAPQKGNVQNILEQGWTINPAKDGNSVNLERETGQVDFNPYLKDFNALAQLTTGIANKVTDIRNDRKYRSDYVKALQQPSYENYDEDGLNPNRIYFKTGGMTRQSSELEQGEVYTSTSGSINKIPETENRHEQGGTLVDDAHRVLEDTSDKRKHYKDLLIDKNTAESLTGYKPKSSKSHSKLFEEANKNHEKQVKKFELKIKSSVDNLEANPADKLATNSMNLNILNLSKIPTSGQIFDSLFNHQEEVKITNNIDQPKEYAIGGNVFDPIDPYKGGKTRKGRYTPTGRDNQYNRDKQYLQQWESLIPGISKLENNQAQSAIYDYMLQSDEGKGVISNMWRSFGITNQGRKYKDLMAMTDNGRFDQNRELDDTQLQSLKKAYTDGYFGVRQLDPLNPQVPRVPITPVDTPTPPPIPQEETPYVPQQPQPRTPINLRTNPKSNFFEPLRWYDVAGPISNLINNDRIPARYDAPEFNQLRLKLQDPRPALQNAQTDYNTATQQLDTITGFGAANQANLFSKKYAIDNQTLGQYENINNNMKNQEIQYNTQVRDRQSVSDVQARGQFEQKYLLGKEAQRQQSAQSWDELYTRIAQNSKLNREGNLLMKLFPAFDQNAEFNNYQIPLRNPIGMGTSGQGISYETDPRTGQRYRIMRGPDGKLISSSKIITDDKDVGAKKTR